MRSISRLCHSPKPDAHSGSSPGATGRSQTEHYRLINADLQAANLCRVRSSLKLRVETSGTATPARRGQIAVLQKWVPPNTKRTLAAKRHALFAIVIGQSVC